MGTWHPRALSSLALQTDHGQSNLERRLYSVARQRSLLTYSRKRQQSSLAGGWATSPKLHICLKSLRSYKCEVLHLKIVYCRFPLLCICHLPWNSGAAEAKNRHCPCVHRLSLYLQHLQWGKYYFYLFTLTMEHWSQGSWLAHNNSRSLWLSATSSTWSLHIWIHIRLQCNVTAHITNCGTSQFLQMPKNWTETKHEWIVSRSGSPEVLKSRAFLWSRATIPNMSRCVCLLPQEDANPCH